MDRVIRVGWAALALVMAVLFVLAAAGQAQAASRKHQPATRAYVARVLTDRALLEDVTYPERREYWNGTECAADLHDVSKAQRRRICFVWGLGFMGDTGRSDAYPTFEPHATIRRDQTATILWRLATYGEDLPPRHAAVFIDVSRRNVHEPAIRWGALHGVICGRDTTPATFDPAGKVTRAQVRELVDRVVDVWRVGESDACG